MSTMVQIPVRVKPPPATGATISPGCAAVAVTTPEKGARTMVSSRLRWETSSPARATRTWACCTGELGAGVVETGARIVDRLRRYHALAGEAAIPVIFGLGVRHGGGRQSRIRLRLPDLGGRQVGGGSGV